MTKNTLITQSRDVMAKALRPVGARHIALAIGFITVLLLSFITQGISDSTVIQSLLAALGGGISGAISALILVALRTLFTKNGWKLVTALLGIGIIAAVMTGSIILEIAVPAAAGTISYIAGLVMVLNAFVTFTPRTELPMIFGTARWATRDDLKTNNMLVQAPNGPNLEETQHAGLFLGQEPETSEAIIYDGDMHVLTIAPTRTGKDQSAILPNLVRSQGSMIVIDPKGESTRLSAKRRAELGQKVMVLDPWMITFSNPPETDSNAGCRPPTQPARAAHDDTFNIADHIARFNPLDRLKADDPDLAGDVMLYADALVMNESQNPHWPNEAKALIAGFIAYIVTDSHEAQRRHLGRLHDILCLPLAQRDEDGNVLVQKDENGQIIDETADTLDEILGRMLVSDIGFVKNSAYRFLQKEERERASVVATAHANTHFLESPRIRENLSKSDFAFTDLKGAAPTTIYLALPLDRLSAFGRWLRLLVSTALIELTRAEFVPASDMKSAAANAEASASGWPAATRKKDEPVRFILNEFAALGRLEAMETAFGTMASLGVQLWAITQDLSQLKRLYGGENWQTFVANAGVFQYFGSRDHETAKYAEQLCGLTTLKKRSVSFGANWSRGGSNGGWSSSHGESESTSIDDVQRPLIFADELMRLPRDQQLLLIENLPPVMAHKWWFYKHQKETPEIATGAVKNSSMSQPSLGRLNKDREGMSS